MLNDFFITRDTTSHLSRFLDQRQLEMTDIRTQLERYASKSEISYEQWWQILEQLNSALHEPALGLQIGASIHVEHCGVLGYLFRTSQNVLEALVCYQRFERLLYSGGQVSAEIKDNNRFCLAWDPDMGLSSFLSDSMLIAALVSIVREILNNPDINPVSVHFTRPIPDSDRQAYAAFFRCPVKGENYRLEITFSLSDLTQAIPFYDKSLHALLGQQAQSLIEQLPEADDFMRSLREAIVKSLNEGCADANIVARQLGLSTRTLHRKLQGKGKIYRDLLRDVRKSLAQRYLADRSINLTETAMLLGYSEQSAFTRAFKSWFDCTPKAYREQLQQN